MGKKISRLVDIYGRGAKKLKAITTPRWPHASKLTFFVSALAVIGVALFTQGPHSAKAALPAPGGVDAGLELWLKADAATVVGGNVTNWDDSTGQHTNETIPAKPYVASAYNFNPTVRFNNGTYISWGTQQLLFGATAGENFSVLRSFATAGQHSGYPSEFGGGGNGAGWGYHNTLNNIRNAWGGSAIRNWNPMTAPAGGPPRSTNDLHIYNELSAPGNYTARFDGLANFTTNVNTVNFNTTESSPHTYVGASHLSVYVGDISEFMVYRRELTAAERARVQSYNAIKYGITLGTTSSPINYVASNGSTTFWNGDATYQNNVFGIGRDDNSALSQKQSRSENAQGIVTIGQGTIEASNAANTNNFSANNSFLMTGDDNGATNTWNSTGVPALDTFQYKRIARTWKVQKTGTIAPMTVSFNVNNASADILPATSGYYLVNLTTGTATPLNSTDGNNYSASGINFNNGDLFTIGTSAATYNVHFRKTVSPVATSITPGQIFTYTVTAENQSNVPMSGVTFADNLSDVVDDAAYNNNVSATTGTATWNGSNQISWTGNLAVGQTATITYSFTLGNPIPGNARLDNGIVSTTTGANCTESPAVDPDCMTTTPLPVVTSQKTLVSPTNPTAGDTIQYQLVVTNQGAGAAATVPIADDLTQVLDDASFNPASASATSGTLSYNPLTKRLNWDGSLAANGSAGDSVAITYSVTVNAANALSDANLNNAAISPDCPNPAIFDPSNPNYEANCVTSTPVSAWMANKTTTAANGIKPGTVTQYTITVENTGAVDLSGGSAPALDDDLTDVIDDAIFDNSTAQATSGTLTYTSPTLHWTGSLNAGQSATITYSATIKPLAGLGNANLANAIGAGPMNCPVAPTANSNDPNFNANCATLTSIDNTDPSTGSGTSPSGNNPGNGLANTGQDIWVYNSIAAGLVLAGFGLAFYYKKTGKYDHA